MRGELLQDCNIALERQTYQYVGKRRGSFYAKQKKNNNKNNNKRNNKVGEKENKNTGKAKEKQDEKENFKETCADNNSTLTTIYVKSMVSSWWH